MVWFRNSIVESVLDHMLGGFLFVGTGEMILKKANLRGSSQVCGLSVIPCFYTIPHLQLLIFKFFSLFGWVWCLQSQHLGGGPRSIEIKGSFSHTEV